MRVRLLHWLILDSGWVGQTAQLDPAGGPVFGAGSADVVTEGSAKPEYDAVTAGSATPAVIATATDFSRQLQLSHPAFEARLRTKLAALVARREDQLLVSTVSRTTGIGTHSAPTGESYSDSLLAVAAKVVDSDLAAEANLAVVNPADVVKIFGDATGSSCENPESELRLRLHGMQLYPSSAVSAGSPLVGGRLATTVTGVVSLRSIRKLWSHPANKGRRATRLGIYVWSRSMYRLGRTAVVPFGSRSRIEVRPEAQVLAAATVARSPVPDWPEMQAWRRLLRPGAVFVDVGAHIGIYSLWAAEQGASVIAVEPNPPVAAMLRSNLARNRIGARVYEVAVADAPGVMMMAGLEQVPTTPTLALAGIGDLKVVVTTLDALLGDEDVAGIKVDVEGAELAVLHGASGLLGRVPVWQLEWNRHADREPVGQLLRDHGYDLMRPDASGALHPSAGDVGRDLFAVLRDRTRPSF